jgi:hypothetical protein
VFDTYQTVDDMTGVGIIFRVTPFTSNPVHDFVLSFSGNGSIRNDDLELQREDIDSDAKMTSHKTHVLPSGIVVELE